MNTLFDLEILQVPKEKYVGERCKNCVHFFHHAYSRKLKYCSAHKQKGTAYGCKKILANDKACQLFESKTKQP